MELYFTPRQEHAAAQRLSREQVLRIGYSPTSGIRFSTTEKPMDEQLCLMCVLGRFWSMGVSRSSTIPVMHNGRLLKSGDAVRLNVGDEISLSDLEFLLTEEPDCAEA